MPDMEQRANLMPSVLLADIGGSNSRFALGRSGGRPEQISIIRNDTVPDLESAIARYLAETGAHPLAAILAVAGPIDGEEVKLTNRDWHFRRPELAARFGFAQLRVVNDFEAVAWGLPWLNSGDVRTLGMPLAPRNGVKIVLGPGTGLGVAALIPSDGRWHVVASEGGHASFGPQGDDEIEVFKALRRECGRISAETVLSGPGMVRLARAMHPHAETVDCESIVARALAGEAAAYATASLFVRLLGRFAGGLALTFKALGGVYLNGGVAVGLAPLLAGGAIPRRL